MNNYKNPEAVLVVIYEQASRQVLMLKRNDDPDFWQSVTGSLENNETPLQAAIREVKEETGIDIQAENLPIFDCHKQIEFEIFPQFRYKYAPNVTHCHEHWFLLPLLQESKVRLTEHSDYRWVTTQEAVEMTKSWNNALAIKEFLLDKQVVTEK